ncbi:MAG: transposase [Microbacterium sp.]
MSKPYPHRVSVTTSRASRETGATIEQIAKGFGVHPMTLQKWLQRAAVDQRTKPGQTRDCTLNGVTPIKEIRDDCFG